MITYQQVVRTNLLPQDMYFEIFEVCVDYVAVCVFKMSFLELRCNNESETHNLLEKLAYSLGRPFEEFFENYHLNAIGSD